MNKFTCISKIRNKSNVIVGYVIQDSMGVQRQFTHDEVELFLRDKSMDICNLQLSSDGRIVDKAVENDLESLLEKIKHVKELNKSVVDVDRLQIEGDRIKLIQKKWMLINVNRDTIESRFFTTVYFQNGLMSVVTTYQKVNEENGKSIVMKDIERCVNTPVDAGSILHYVFALYNGDENHFKLCIQNSTEKTFDNFRWEEPAQKVVTEGKGRSRKKIENNKVFGKLLNIFGK